MKEIINKVIPHLIVVLLFWGMTALYFYPEMVDNKGLIQGDVTSVGGWGKDLVDYHEQTGKYDHWSNRMFSGMPANYTFTPPMINVFSYISSIFGMVTTGDMGFVFQYLIGFYIFMLSLGCKPVLSFVGAIAFSFASYNFIIIEAGHLNKCLSMATMAPIIGGIILCYRKQFLWGSIITLLFTGLNILWNHQQITYYLLIIILLIAIIYLIYAIREKELKNYFKSSIILVVVALLAIAPDAGRLFATANYTKETMRGGAVLQNKADGEKASSGLDINYAYMWSYGKMETMTLLIPDFYGASSTYNIGKDSESYRLLRSVSQGNQADDFSKAAPMYWGGDDYKSFTSGPVYVGAIVCFLFILGLLILRGRERWWLLAVTIVSIVLAWGRHFPLINEFLFYHLPLYNKFRTPEMALVMAEVSMAAMAVLAIKAFMEEKDRRKLLKPLYIAGGVTGGLCLIFALFGSGLMSFTAPSDERFNFPDLAIALVADRKSMLWNDSWRSFFLIALASGTLWYYISKPFKASYLLFLLGTLIFIDLWTVDKRFINHDSFVPKKKAQEIVATEADKLILQDKDPNYRVLNLASSTFNESHTSYFHKSVGGYSPAKLRRYQDIIDYHFSGKININVLNMLNTRYIIMQGNKVQQNPGALGNCWFVEDLRWVNSPDEEIVSLNDFDPSRTTFIDKVWKDKLPDWFPSDNYSFIKQEAKIEMTDYRSPGNIFYESSSSQPGLAVFSEVYYKTWKAYIDGVESPLVRVNYILRGLAVPAGEHKIEFKCIDETFIQGAKISKISSIVVGIVILCLLGFAIWTTVKKKDEQVA